MLLLTSGPKPVPVSGVSQLASQCATRKQRPCVVLSGVWRRSGSTVRERRGGGEAATAGEKVAGVMCEIKRVSARLGGKE